MNRKRSPKKITDKVALLAYMDDYELPDWSPVVCWFVRAYGADAYVASVWRMK